MTEYCLYFHSVHIHYNPNISVKSTAQYMKSLMVFEPEKVFTEVIKPNPATQ